MNIDQVVGELEVGFQNPGTTIQRVYIEADKIKIYGLRRPRNINPPSYLVWNVQIGEMNYEKFHFYDFKLRNVLLKALEWKNGQAQLQQTQQVSTPPQIIPQPSGT